MIKIRRGATPGILRGCQPTPKLYDRPEVINALLQMQHNKCCYCEQYVGGSGHERAVEHFRPKAESAFPELANTWGNLLHACAGCNGAKWNHFPTRPDKSPLLIDPSDPALDPEDHLDFVVADDNELEFGRVKAKIGSDMATPTIEKVGLDRPQRRYERVAEYQGLYAAYVAILEAQNTATKGQKVRAFENLLKANNPHAAFARAFARFKRVDDRFGVQIPTGAD